MTEPQIMPRPIPSTSCPIQKSLIILPLDSLTDTNVNQLPKFGQMLYFNSILVQHLVDVRKSGRNMSVNFSI